MTEFHDDGVAGTDAAEAETDPGRASAAHREAELTEVTPGEQSELDLGVVSTGNVDVDAAVAGLAGLGDRPVSEHPEVYERVHRDLQAAMSSISDDLDLEADTAHGRTDL